MSQSFMEGTKQFLDAVSSGSDPESTDAERYVKRQIGSSVPNIVRRIAASLDTNEDGQVIVRQRDSWADEVKYAIPFLRESLPESRDQFGRTKLRGTPAGEFWNLTYSTDDLTKLDEVRAEFDRLGAPLTRRTRLRAEGETGADFSARMSYEGPYLWKTLQATMHSDAYDPATIRAEAKRQGWPEDRMDEVVKTVQRDLLGRAVQSARRDMTNFRKQAKAAGWPDDRLPEIFNRVYGGTNQ